MKTELNVLFIVVDTLRASHLGWYGYHRNTSPCIDAFAAQSVAFDWMLAPAIPTHPSFVTMNSGQFSATHGVVAHGSPSAIPRTIPWLPSIVQKHGYTTCGVDNLGEWRFGFATGYEFYIDPTRRRALALNCDNREINRRALPWLKQHAREKFYMVVHYWDPHTPYLPPRAYRNLFYEGDPCDPDNRSLEKLEEHPLGRVWRETWFPKLGKHITDAAYVEAQYDAEIRYCDEGIGLLLDAVRKLKLDRNTLIVLTSDHGELMYRHGIFFDHHGLYDGNLHVPLLIHHPEFAPRRVPHFVTHADLAPTILELCGIEPPTAMEGVSLVPLLRGESDAPIRDFVVSQECTWQMKWAIRTPTHKFILAREEDFYGTPMRELYDLRDDPGEFRNIAGEDPDTARTLEEQLEGWVHEKMRKNGLTVDPLVAHGLTLGTKWKEERRARQAGTASDTPPSPRSARRTQRPGAKTARVSRR